MRSRAEKTRRETCRISFKMNIPKKYLIVDDRKVFCVKSTLDRDDFPWISPSFPSFLPTMLIEVEVEGRRSKLFRIFIEKARERVITTSMRFPHVRLWKRNHSSFTNIRRKIRNNWNTILMRKKSSVKITFIASNQELLKSRGWKLYVI